jgi:hypothetical protein
LVVEAFILALLISLRHLISADPAFRRRVSAPSLFPRSAARVDAFETKHETLHNGNCVESGGLIIDCVFQ